MKHEFASVESQTYALFSGYRYFVRANVAVEQGGRAGLILHSETRYNESIDAYSYG